jgi:hypothetical protein
LRRFYGFLYRAPEVRHPRAKRVRKPVSAILEPVVIPS